MGLGTLEPPKGRPRRRLVRNAPVHQDADRAQSLSRGWPLGSLGGGDLLQGWSKVPAPRTKDPRNRTPFVSRPTSYIASSRRCFRIPTCVLSRDHVLLPRVRSARLRPSARRHQQALTRPSSAIVMAASDRSAMLAFASGVVAADTALLAHGASASWAGQPNIVEKDGSLPAGRRPSKPTGASLGAKRDFAGPRHACTTRRRVSPA